MLRESKVSFALPRDIRESENIRGGSAFSHHQYSPPHSVVTGSRAPHLFLGRGNGDSKQRRHLAKANRQQPCHLIPTPVFFLLHHAVTYTEHKRDSH